MIVGHQKQLQFLQYMARTGSLPHALLFSGEDGLGKKTIAFDVAKMLNCQALGAGGEACQKCRLCVAIANGIHPAVVFAEPQVNSNSAVSSKGGGQAKSIQIAQIRRLERYLSMRSAFSPGGGGGHKVIIIDGAHEMTIPAQHAFLKTLEEPRGNAVIILITPKPHLLLPTVISRSQQLKFFPVPQKELENFLAEKGTPKDLMLKIIKLSLRRPGMALRLLADEKKLKHKEKILKDVQDIYNSNLSQRFQWSQDMAKDPQAIPEFLDFWLRFFRGLMLAKMGLLAPLEVAGLSRALLLTGRSAAPRQFFGYSLSHLRKIINTIQEVDLAITTSNVNPRLALDVLMLEL